MENTKKKDVFTDVENDKNFLLETLLKGVLVLLPITIIILLIAVIFNFIFSIIAPISAIISPGANEPHWFFNVISLLILLIIIFIAGTAIKNKMGRTYFRIFEKKYLTKIPLYNLVYETVYQFAGLKKLPFSEVVLIDPYNTGCLLTGFITDKVNDDLYTIFVPTAPNPTNGNIYHVKKAMITRLDVSSQDAMRSIVGMGTGTASIVSKSPVVNMDLSAKSKVILDNEEDFKVPPKAID